MSEKALARAVYIGLGCVVISCFLLEILSSAEGLRIGSFVGASAAAFLLVPPAMLAWRDIRLRSKPAFWFDIAPKLMDGGDDPPYVKTLFRNSPVRPADCRVTLRCTLDERELQQSSLGDGYNGERTILVPPGGFHGVFSLGALLDENGYSFEDVKNQPLDGDGHSRKLRVSVASKYRFTDTEEWLEDLPTIRFYFDFEKLIWVYDA